jgi:hypothetical protein
MASAKKQAQSYLGNENDYINLKGLNEERQLANDVYNTNTKSFQDAYNDLLSNIASNRTKAKTDFGSGRSTISENAYLQNRNDLSNFAARGLNGGIAQLNKLGNRMETGRQFSDLANTYYNTLNELDANEKTYTNTYNTNMEGAKNTLNATLANISSREKAGRNAYKAAVAQLAEQIQARRDAADAAAKSYALQVKALEDSNRQTLINDLLKIAGDGRDASKVIQAGQRYMSDVPNSTMQDAIKFMHKYGIYKPSNFENIDLSKYKKYVGTDRAFKALATGKYDGIW